MIKISKHQSYYCYIPIIIVIALGYISGGVLSFGVHYLNMLPSLENASARFVLIIFGMGILGSTVYCSRYWAVDMDEALCKTEFLPHFYDFFGYLTTILGGGITGIILYLLLKTGTTLALSSNDFHEIRVETSLVIGFCGGLFHFKVQSVLHKFVTDILRTKES